MNPTTAFPRPVRKHRRGHGPGRTRRILAASAASLLSLLAIPGSAFAGIAAPPATFWLGGTDGTWSGNNWASDAAGTPTTAIPTALAVTFYATGATNLTTTLGQNFTIQSLTINTHAVPAPVTIDSGTGGPFTLTLSGNAGTGVHVQGARGVVVFQPGQVGQVVPDAGLVTIGANLTLAGGSDTITVNNVPGAVINGSVGGGNGLIKEGAGTLTLTGPSTYTGGTTVNAGTLVIDNNGTTTHATLGSGATTVNEGSGGLGTNGTLKFLNFANAGSSTFLMTGGTNFGAAGGTTSFYDSASAGSGTFTANGAVAGFATGGKTSFYGNATAGSGMFTTNGGTLPIPGAPAFAETAGDVGIAASTSIINSGIPGVAGGTTSFHDTATAGTGTFITNGPTATGTVGGTTSFHQSSTADHATFTTNGGTTSFFDNATAGSGAFTTNSGTTDFHGSATAGTGTFTNNGGIAVGAYAGGTRFYDTSTAGGGGFTTNGGTAGSAVGGYLIFWNSTSAGSGTFTTNGGTTSGANGGATSFFERSTTANGTFTTNGSMASGAYGGAVNFFGPSAGSARFITNGGTDTERSEGSVNFYYGASAANAIFTTNGGTTSGARGGAVNFLDTTVTAGNATFTTNGGAVAGAQGGTVNFQSTSTAGSATITAGGGLFAGGGGATVFNDTSGAQNATIVAEGAMLPGGVGGVTQFNNFSHADNATLIANGGSSAGAGGGLTLFRDVSSGGSATLIANGGRTAGAGGGVVQFVDQSSLGSAILIANGGTSGGAGGAIITRSGVGDPEATMKIFGNGKLDISGIASSATTIRSIDGDGSVFLGGKLLAIVGNEQKQTLSGLIQDGGLSGGTGGSIAYGVRGASFQSPGTGTLAITGANTYTGATDIFAGTLAVGNTKALGNGRVAIVGGTLRTTGGPLVLDIGAGNFVVFGPVFKFSQEVGGVPFLTVSPNIHGGGTFLATVGGTTPGVTHDQLRTTGSAEISGGTLALVQLNGFHLAPGDKVVLISALGGVANGTANGTAMPEANVTGLAAFSTSPLLVPVVNLYTTSVVLELMQGSFAALAGTLALTPNQLAVAGALDTIATQIGSKTGVLKQFDYLDSLPTSEIATNLDLLTPAALTSIFALSASLANVQTANIQQRLADIRGVDAGSSGTPVGGGGGGAQGPKGARGKSIECGEEERWGMWMTGSGEFTRVGSTTNAAGFSLDSGGVTAGVDYRFTEHFAAGISLGYMNTTASLSNGGNVDVDGGRVGAYATYFNRGLHLDAAVSGGPNSYATRRTTPNNTTATGSPTGTEVNLLFAAGYDWKWKGLTLGPTASFQYTNVLLNGFTESGTFAPLSVAAQNAESLRTALGMHATFDVKMGRAILRPEVRAAWQHEFGDTSHSLTSRFATLGGGAFTVSGPETGRDSLLLGAGFSIRWSERFATYAYYDAELLRTNYSSNNISVGFRYQF